MTFWLPIQSAVERELIRFYRQRGRIIGSLGTPLLFWGFLASGMGAAFPSPSAQMGYGEFFYPGIILLTVLFTSIFSTISLIEDRHEGFLQSVLVAPVSPTALVLGKILGGSLLAMGQGVLLLLLAPWVGVPFTVSGVLMALATLFAASLALSAFSFCFAWKLDSVQGFHSVMNLFLFPMWLLSGAFFPLSRAPGWLKPLMWLNPMSYSLDGLRQSFYVGAGTFIPETLPWLSGLLAVLAFGGVFLTISTRFVAGGRKP